MSWHSIHRDLQEDIQARLENDSYFSDITVLLQRKGNIESDVLQAISSLNEKTGKAGVCVVVMMPETEAPDGDLPGPPIEIVTGLQVIELPVVNENTGEGGTGKSAESVANVVLNLLHRYIPYLLGNVLVADAKPIRPLKSDGATVEYIVTVRMRTGLDNTAKVQTPELSEAAGVITLSCGTSGATIHYTTDGSYPGPANENATAYSVPFTPASGVTLRYAASKTGLIPSDTAAADID